MTFGRMSTRIIIYSVAAAGGVAFLSLNEHNPDLIGRAREEIVALTKSAPSLRSVPASAAVAKPGAGAAGPGLLLQEPVPPVMPAACTAAQPEGRAIVAAGDKVQIRFFERTRLAQPGTTATKVKEAMFERLDLAGVYEVDEVGQIGIPLLGRIEVRGFTLPCVEAAAAQRFFDSTRSAVTVTVTFSSRLPVVVMGAVRSPGSYGFLPGMTIRSLLATAGASLEGGVTDFRAAEELLHRKADLERQALGIALTVRRAEAERAGSRELALDDSLRRRITAELGLQRLKSEQATLAAAVDAAEATAVSEASALAGYDARIKVAAEQLDVAKQQTGRLDARVSELKQLRERGITSMTLLDDKEFSAMTLQRLRLASIAQITDLRAARDDAAQRAAVTSVGQRQLRERQLRDALERKNEIDAQIISVERQFGSLSGQTLRGSASASLSVVIRRAGALGPIEIAAEQSTSLQPGDIIAVAVKLPPSEHLVGPGTAPFVLGSTQPRTVTP